MIGHDHDYVDKKLLTVVMKTRLQNNFTGRLRQSLAVSGNKSNKMSSIALLDVRKISTIFITASYLHP